MNDSNFKMNEQQQNIINALKNQQYVEFNDLLEKYIETKNDHMFSYYLLMSTQNYSLKKDYGNSDLMYACAEKILFFIISHFNFNKGMQDWSRDSEMFPYVNNEKTTYTDMLLKNSYFKVAFFNICFEKYNTSSGFIKDCLYKINKNSNPLDIKYEIYDRLILIFGNINNLSHLYKQTIYNEKEAVLHKDNNYICYIFKDWFRQIKEKQSIKLLEENNIILSHFLNFMVNFLIDNEEKLNILDLCLFNNLFSFMKDKIFYYVDDLEYMNHIKEIYIQDFKKFNNIKTLHPFIKIAFVFNDFIEDDLKKEILKKNYKFIKSIPRQKISRIDDLKAQFNGWNIKKPIEIWPVIIKNKHIGLMGYLLELNVYTRYTEKEYGQWLINGIDVAKYKSKTSIEMIEKLNKAKIIDIKSSKFLYGLLNFNEVWIKDVLRKQEFQFLLNFIINDIGEKQYENNLIEIKENMPQHDFNKIWNNLKIIYSDLFLFSKEERDDILNISNFKKLEASIINKNTQVNKTMKNRIL